VLVAAKSRWSEAAVIVLSRIAQVAGMLLYSRIGTSFLPPEQMAGVVQMTSIAGFFNLLLIVPVWHYVARGFNEWRQADVLRRHAILFIDFVVIVAIGSAIVGWALDHEFGLVVGIGEGWVAGLIGLYVVSSAISTLGTSGANLLGDRIQFAMFSNVPIWGGLVLSVIAYRFRPVPASWALGQVGGLAIGCVSYVTLRKKFGPSEVSSPMLSPPSVRPFTVRTVAWFAWPTVVTAGLWWVQSQSYRFVLDRVGGLASVGLFAIGYGLAASPIALYEGVFGQYYEPIFYRALHGKGAGGQAEAWNNYAAGYLPGLVTVAIFIAASGTFMARLLVGERFRDAAAVLVVWGAVVEGMRAAGGMVYNLGMAKVDTRLTIAPVAIGAVVAPIGVFYFAKVDPLQGTAAALALAGIASLLLGVRATRTALPIRWPVVAMLRAAAASAPLAIGFVVLRWVDPVPSAMVAFLGLAIGGLYLLAIQLWLLNSLTTSVAHENN
jgi:hypothetical protein